MRGGGRESRTRTRRPSRKKKKRNPQKPKKLTSHSRLTIVPIHATLKKSKAASAEEREHAELLMDYQNMRGGRVKLASISELVPFSVLL